jgi:hypothetical protein
MAAFTISRPLQTPVILHLSDGMYHRWMNGKPWLPTWRVPPFQEIVFLARQH